VCGFRGPRRALACFLGAGRKTESGSGDRNGERNANSSISAFENKTNRAETNKVGGGGTGGDEKKNGVTDQKNIPWIAINT